MKIRGLKNPTVFVALRRVCHHLVNNVWNVQILRAGEVEVEFNFAKEKSKRHEKDIIQLSKIDTELNWGQTKKYKDDKQWVISKTGDFNPWYNGNLELEELLESIESVYEFVDSGNDYIQHAEFVHYFDFLNSIVQQNKNEKKLPIVLKNPPIIKLKTLELIAQEIGNLGTGTKLIDFLTECGVGDKLIEYPQTKWRMVNNVFIALVTSPDPKNQEILFKIIEEASHPLMYNGDEEIAKAYENKFNKLLKYDGFTLKNYKVKKINKEVKQDNDLDLYLKKKISIENWRDDLPHPITELSFDKNTIEQICYSLWDLFVSDIISFGANTFPEDILVETDPRFHQEIAFNWNLIRDLDNNPYKVEANYSFDIEILDEKRLKKDIDEEISEFIANKVNIEKIEAVKDFYLNTKHLETPSYLRAISHNYYAYKKQKEILLNHIATIYGQFENEILVIKFNEIANPNISILRTLLALEVEGFFTIKELSNDKKEWTDEDNIYAKVQLVKSKIPAIKKFPSIAEEPEIKSEADGKLSRQAREPIPIRGEIKIEGLKEGLEALAMVRKEDQGKFPYKLPAGTRWENFTIKFLDDENVFIQVGRLKYNASYKEMGFIGKGNNPNPSEAWTFLEVLAKLNGELNLKDPEARDEYKKQKELLIKALQNYFSLDYDPFYPYRSSPEKQGNSYKIKITLIPPPNTKEKADTDEDDNDDLGIKEYLDEQNPQVYEGK